MNKPSAVIFSTVEGHASIAEAAAVGLRQHGWNVKVITYVDPSFHFYRIFYRYAPSLFSLVFQTLSNQNVLKLVNTYTERTHAKKLCRDLDHHKPDLILSTWVGYDSSINNWRNKVVDSGKKPPVYINLLADPWSFSPSHISITANSNCLFDQTSVENCKNLELESQPKTAVTGWFVRPQFRIDEKKRVVRRQLGLQEDVITLLFAAGSEGETKSAKLIPELFANSPQPLQIILACGSNTMLKAKFDKFGRELPPGSQHYFSCLPFTKNIHHYMQAADLMVGKAGPNTIFEAVAAETPFFVTTHISGQEDGNLDLVREYEIGYVEEDLEKAEALLHDIVARPEQLEHFQPTIKKLAQYNDKAIERLVELIEELSKE